MSKFYKENKKIIFISLLIMALSLLLSFKAEEDSMSILDNGKVQREEEANETVTLNATYEGKEYEDLEINISKYLYTEEEFNEALNKNEENLIEKLLGQNSDLQHVETDLDFFDELDGLPFSCEWEVEDSDLMDNQGNILTDSNFETQIFLTVTYREFRKEYSFKIYAYPGELIKDRVRKDKILSAIETNETLTREEKYYTLPSEIDGEPVTFSESKKTSRPIYPAIGFLISVGLFIASDGDRKKEIKKRNELILWEYPIVLQNMSMYLSAGMSIRNIWKKIVNDSKAGKNTNPIYEEMEITLNEMESGISELAAYERFGNRVKIPELTRFMALLSQNVKRGSSKLSKILSEESGKAFSEMKYKVRKKGEEAGTKLLLPMMALLIMVMAIIMVPAFFSL